MKTRGLLASLAAILDVALAASKGRLIIDTDMLNFDDDPLAIGLANIFQSWGEVELVGIMASMSPMNHYADSCVYTDYLRLLN